MTSTCPKSIHFWRRRASRKAQATVEFALIALPFFIILFALIDYAQIYFFDNSLQNAMREATRFGTAGRVIPDMSSGAIQYNTNNGVGMVKAINDGGGREASRNECIRYWFQSNCAIQNFPISNIIISSAPTLDGVPPYTLNNDGHNLVLSNGGTAANKGPGGQGDYMQVTATYTLHTITPIFGYLNGYSRSGMNTYKVRVSAIVKNEPAKLNFLHTNMYSDEP